MRCVWILLALWSTFAGCRRQDEDEKLRSLIDSAGVHLYVGLKVAASGAERAETQAAHAALERLLVHRTSTLGDALQLGELALDLRRLGQSEVSQGRSSQLPPLLPRLSALAPKALVPSEARNCRASNHGALLLALLLAKLAPSPLPIDTHAALYEAYMGGEDPLAWRALEPTVRAAQAYAYAAEGLCEHAGVLEERLAPPASSEAQSAIAELTALAPVLGHLPATTLPSTVLVAARSLPWAAPVLAHVTTARCFEGSDAARAGRAWQRAADALQALGAHESELGLLRAYLAYRAEDFEAVRGHLAIASESRLITDQERLQITQLGQSLSKSDRSRLERILDAPRVAAVVVAAVHERLRATGLPAMVAQQLAPSRALLSNLSQATQLAPEGIVKRSTQALRRRISSWL
jgi:hypothetical protein